MIEKSVSLFPFALNAWIAEIILVSPKSESTERGAFEAVRRRLPEPLRPVVTFAYVTGWRVRAKCSQ